MNQIVRLNWPEVSPAGAKALYGVHHYVLPQHRLAGGTHPSRVPARVADQRLRPLH